MAVNTTYYGHVSAIINSGFSPYSNFVTTATLATVPVSAASTWTAVNITSLTVAWAEGLNPTDVTLYVVEISTLVGFNGGGDKSSSTYLTNAGFIDLKPDTTYYAQVNTQDLRDGVEKVRAAG